MNTQKATKPPRRSDEVADVIARDIRSGALSTGTWLKQVDVESRYNASRADIRRALEILLQKQLVEQIPERGFYVRGVDERRQRELREIRVTLECSMAKSIIANADPAKLQELTDLAHRFSEAVEAGSIADRYESNQNFHVALAQLCSNRELSTWFLIFADMSPHRRCRSGPTWRAPDCPPKSTFP